MEKYGVALPTEMGQYIDKTKGSNGQRSRRMRELIQLGIAAEEVLVDASWFPPDPDQREQMVREAMEDYVEEHTG